MEALEVDKFVFFSFLIFVWIFALEVDISSLYRYHPAAPNMREIEVLEVHSTAHKCELISQQLAQYL